MCGPNGCSEPFFSSFWFSVEGEFSLFQMLSVIILSSVLIILAIRSSPKFHSLSVARGIDESVETETEAEAETNPKSKVDLSAAAESKMKSSLPAQIEDVVQKSYWKDIEERRLRQQKMKLEIEELKETLASIKGSVSTVAKLQTLSASPLVDAVLLKESSLDSRTVFEEPVPKMNRKDRRAAKRKEAEEEALAERIRRLNEPLPTEQFTESESSGEEEDGSRIEARAYKSKRVSGKASESSAGTAHASPALTVAPLPKHSTSAAGLKEKLKLNLNDTAIPAPQSNATAAPSSNTPSGSNSPPSTDDNSPRSPRSPSRGRSRSVWDRLASTLNVVTALKQQNTNAGTVISGRSLSTPRSTTSRSSSPSRMQLSMEERIRDDIEQFRERRLSFLMNPGLQREPSVSSVEFQGRRDDTSPHKAHLAKTKTPNSQSEWIMSLRSSEGASVTASNLQRRNSMLTDSSFASARTKEDIQRSRERSSSNLKELEKKTLEKVQELKVRTRTYSFENSLRATSEDGSPLSLKADSPKQFVVDPERAAHQYELSDRLSRLPRHRAPRRYVDSRGEVHIEIAESACSHDKTDNVLLHVFEEGPVLTQKAQLLRKPGLNGVFGPDSFAARAHNAVALKEKSYISGYWEPTQSHKKNWRAQDENGECPPSPVDRAQSLLERVKRRSMQSVSESTSPKHPPPGWKGAVPSPVVPSAKASRQLSPVARRPEPVRR
eukprot:ANDGO_07559.mRNA.1 hypothetical protein